MPETESKLFRQMQPLMKREFLRLNRSAGALSQYAGAQVQSHAHDRISSNAVLYTALQGVQSFLVSTTVTLTSAQILALHTTPIVLVANPGPRSFVFVEGIAGRLTYGGTAYTGANNLEFRYTNGSGIKVCADMSATLFLNAAANTYSYSPWQVDFNRNVDSNFTPVGGDTGNNGQVVVSVPTANPATGNSTIVLTTFYRIISFIT